MLPEYSIILLKEKTVTFLNRSLDGYGLVGKGSPFCRK